MSSSDAGGSGQWPPPGGDQPPPSNQPWGGPPPGASQDPYGGQYGGPPGGGWQAPPGLPPGQPIPTNLVWGILTTLLCCLPFGIVSIVFAAQVSSKQAAGDYTGAMDASKKAKTWAIVSAVTGFVGFIVAFGVGALGSIFGAGQGY
jgi:hypothetical protein